MRMRRRLKWSWLRAFSIQALTEIRVPHPLCVLCAKGGRPQKPISTVKIQAENALDSFTPPLPNKPQTTRAHPTSFPPRQTPPQPSSPPLALADTCSCSRYGSSRLRRIPLPNPAPKVRLSARPGSRDAFLSATLHCSKPRGAQSCPAETPLPTHDSVSPAGSG